jgi:hypothetical protein
MLFLISCDDLSNSKILYTSGSLEINESRPYSTIIDSFIAIAQYYELAYVINYKAINNIEHGFFNYYYRDFPKDTIYSGIIGKLSIYRTKNYSSKGNNTTDISYTMDYGNQYIEKTTADTISGQLEFIYKDDQMDYIFEQAHFKNFIINNNTINGVYSCDYSGYRSWASREVKDSTFSDTIFTRDQSQIIIQHKFRTSTQKIKSLNKSSETNSRAITFIISYNVPVAIPTNYPYIVKGEIIIESAGKKCIVNFGNGENNNDAILSFDGKSYPLKLKHP